MKNLLLLTLTVSMIAYSCGNVETTPDQPEVPSEAAGDNPEYSHQVISDFLFTDPSEGLTQHENEFTEWVLSQDTIEQVWKDQLLAEGQGGKAVTYYTYDYESEGWDVYLLNVTSEDKLQVVAGDFLATEALQFSINADGTYKPEQVLQKNKKKKKKKPKGVDADKDGCTKKVCSGSICNDMTFIPCRIGKDRKVCVTWDDCAGSTEGSVLDEIKKF
ncbi:MAG TPA: hypothetical protein DHN29_11330 [Cytophagales bacterium]|nr:hypothetical protein [Rickettsiales bacterium]HCX22500.1 hypothetical protein [Cytophagales bacterium]